MSPSFSAHLSRSLRWYMLLPLYTWVTSATLPVRVYYLLTTGSTPALSINTPGTHSAAARAVAIWLIDWYIKFGSFFHSMLVRQRQETPKRTASATRSGNTVQVADWLTRLPIPSLACHCWCCSHLLTVRIKQSTVARKRQQQRNLEA